MKGKMHLSEVIDLRRAALAAAADYALKLEQLEQSAREQATQSVRRAETEARARLDELVMARNEELDACRKKLEEDRAELAVRIVALQKETRISQSATQETRR